MLDRGTCGEVEHWVRIDTMEDFGTLGGSRPTIVYVVLNMGTYMAENNRMVSLLSPKSPPLATLYRSMLTPVELTFYKHLPRPKKGDDSIEV